MSSEDVTMDRKVMDVGWRSVFHYDEELCGDRVMLRLDDNTFMGVLADGMGSGVKANILSTMTGTILSTMLSGGADVEAAVDTVIKTLPVCSERGLSYCTFTVVTVDPQGLATFVEYDNPVTWILRSGKIFELDYVNREVCGKNIREATLQLAPGDIIVVTSDGAVNAAADNIFSTDWDWAAVGQWLEDNHESFSSAQRLAYGLTEKVNDLYFGQPADDTTAMVVKVLKSNVVDIIFGPPKDKTMDRQMVRDFMSADGDMKIVCGGTTAQMVSRVTGQILVPLEGDDDGSGVPPISFMDGVDLVTEGVMTMNRVWELMKEYFDAGENYTDFAKLDMLNGAAMIAKQLAEECTHVRFFLGGAQNSAYADDKKLGANRKRELAENIAALMKKYGRMADICYYN